MVPDPRAVKTDNHIAETCCFFEADTFHEVTIGSLFLVVGKGFFAVEKVGGESVQSEYPQPLGKMAYVGVQAVDLMED